MNLSSGANILLLSSHHSTMSQFFLKTQKKKGKRHKNVSGQSVVSVAISVAICISCFSFSFSLFQFLFLKYTSKQTTKQYI